MQLCTACRRHVKTTSCPFCGGAGAQTTPAGLPGNGLPGNWLSRAQLMSGVALAGAVVAGCTEPSSQPVAPNPVATEQTGSVAVPAYGAPAPEPEPQSSGAAAPVDAGRAEPHRPVRIERPNVPAYGGPSVE
ncbi:MAG: hypothetical protein EOP08_06415 [Proteobacteria bacterium]|nr:MAG: hypothetical protein EOP08_06415 [Pseudomonadota bacterium]